MISINLTFGIAEAEKMFKDAGLDVSMHDFDIHFPGRHGNDYQVPIPLKAVRDPHTGEYHRLDELFKIYIDKKKEQLFLNPEKLEVYNLFNKHKKNENTLG